MKPILAFRLAVAVAAMCSVAAGSRCLAQAPAADTFQLQAKLFSFLPGVGAESYRAHGQSPLAGNAAVGLGGFRTSAGTYDVEVQLTWRTHHPRAVVIVTQQGPATGPVRTEREFDLGGMDPQMMDVATDADGRVYRLTLSPGVEPSAAPVRFRSQELRLEAWSFPDSPVILNDLHYIGSVSASYGSLLTMDISGVAKIECSLIPFQGAQPGGVLRAGIVTLTGPDGAALRITNARNGVHQEVLPGGPYTVWVRWGAPTHSVEETRKLLAEQLANVKQRVERGDISLDASALRRIEALSISDAPYLVSFGLRPLAAEEIVEP